MQSKLLNACKTLFWVIICGAIFPGTMFSQPAADKLSNPVILGLRDGCVERFMGYYYAMGGGTKGKIRVSKNLIYWDEAVQSVSTNGAIWLNDPQWTQAYVYAEVAAGDILYRNGVFHVYWNGIGHAYSPTPLGPYKEASVSEPFDDYGIDMQVFQDENGDIYWVKKRNPSDPHPLTGAASNIDGPEVWVFKMNSPFLRKDITQGGVQLTHQPGHPTSVNHHNFEGPELCKYRGHYYLFYASNRMGPRSGMYEVGVAESDGPMNFNNAKKYPHPVQMRNTEQHLIDYKVILHTAEHGGWTSGYTTTSPGANWTNTNFDDSSWTTAQGGYGRQEYDLFGDTGRFTNAKIRARKTNWNTTNIYIRRKFTLDKVPSKITLKYWLFADANFYINGNKISINARNNTYSMMLLDSSLLVQGENIIAVEATSPCSDPICQQFVDFGLYDTGDRDGENIMVSPAQPNFVTGPNGFERWMMYKAYFNASEQQGIDRIHFYNKEVVVENSTVKNTSGYRPKPASPGFITYCDYSFYYPYKFIGNTSWKISGGTLQPLSPSGGELIFRKEAETNYRFEVPFRLRGANSYAGVYAFYQDSQNWLRISIKRDKTWKIEENVNGTVTETTANLPDKFAFLENSPLVSAYEEPWHTLTVYKNDNRFRVELDYFNLTLNGEIVTSFNGKGMVGLTASSDQVSFDAIQYTMGWDEYDQNISGWKKASGTWKVSGNGFMQSGTGSTAAFKGDPAWNYEFSVYMKNMQLPSAGKNGYYPLYIDEQNYVRAVVNYATKTLDIEGKDNGSSIEPRSISLKKKVLRYYTSNVYPTTSYQYDFRNESLVSGVDVLWFEGNYPYLNQTFDLPKTVQFYALQNGSWILLNAQLEGELRFSDMNHFSFPAIKTKTIRMDVTNHTGNASRAFSAYFDEEASAGYFLRCRREKDGLHLFLDDAYVAKIEGNWGKSGIGLCTENLSAIYNGMLYYQTGGVPVKTITVDPVGCAVGESVQLSATVLPLNATNQVLYWESSDPSVASVTENGVLTRHTSGDVKIKAYTTDGGIASGSLELHTTGLQRTSQEAFRVFPNPADKVLYYLLKDAGEMTIYSLAGEKVAHHTPDGSNQIPVDRLNPGVYFLSAQYSGSVYTTRFVVNR